MRIAIVHDWLVTYGGAERVLEEILRLYPHADLFSLIDVLPSDQREFLRGRPVRVSLLQRLPGLKKRYRQYLPWMPVAIERFDLTGYDLVISVSFAVAKGVITSPDQLHICYLQARNLKYAYEERSNYPGGRFRRLLEDLLLSRLRVWDSVASHRPDVTVSNSKFVAQWHLHRHRISSTVIYPPVDTTHFAGFFQPIKEDYYVTVGRLEPYKRFDLVVNAFGTLGHRLVVIGDGTELKSLRASAGPATEFLGYQPPDVVARMVAGARAFVFAGREDFGIAPLEAQACGTPVITYGRGAAPELIQDLGHPDPTGLLFNEQTVASLIEAIQRFAQNQSCFDPETCRKNALRFAPERFRREFQAYVAEQWPKAEARRRQL